MGRSFSRLALAAAAALAVAAAVMRTVLRRRRTAATSQGLPGRRRVSCACGQEYVVVGTDRHRVYWLAGAGARDPVLGQRCSVCQTPLPAEQEAARMT
jgi:hypothetical protein